MKKFVISIAAGTFFLLNGTLHAMEANNYNACTPQELAQLLKDPNVLNSPERYTEIVTYFARRAYVQRNAVKKAAQQIKSTEYFFTDQQAFAVVVDAWFDQSALLSEHLKRAYEVHIHWLLHFLPYDIVRYYELLLIAPHLQKCIDASSDPLSPYVTPINLTPVPEAGQQRVVGICFSGDGKYLAVKDTKHTVSVWNVAENNYIQQWQLEPSGLGNMIFSPSGQYFALSSDDNCMHILSVDTGITKHRYQAHSNTIHTIAFSEDEQCIASGGNDEKLVMYDCLYPNEMHTINLESVRKFPQSIIAIAFVPQSRYLIACAVADRTVRIWSSTDQCFMTFVAKEDPLKTISCSFDGQFIAAGGENGVYIWPLKHNPAATRVEGKVLAAYISPTVLAVGQGKAIKLLDGDSTYLLAGTKNAKKVSLHGGKCFTAGLTDTPKIWDLKKYDADFSLALCSLSLAQIEFIDVIIKQVQNNDPLAAQALDTELFTSLPALIQSSIKKMVEPL